MIKNLFNSWGADLTYEKRRGPSVCLDTSSSYALYSVDAL